MSGTIVTLGERHPSLSLLLKLFERALGEKAADFHGVPAWLDLAQSADPTGWHRLDFGPYQVHFPQSQQPVDELRTASTSVPLPAVLQLLDDDGEIEPALDCELSWIEDYNSWMLFREVVAHVSDPRQQVSLADARQLDEAYEIGDEMAEFVAEPGELWAVLFREAYLLPERSETESSGLSDDALDAMLARASTPDVHVLVSEIRRLRALLS